MKSQQPSSTSTIQLHPHPVPTTGSSPIIVPTQPAPAVSSPPPKFWKQLVSKADDLFMINFPTRIGATFTVSDANKSVAANLTSLGPDISHRLKLISSVDPLQLSCKSTNLAREGKIKAKVGQYAGILRLSEKEDEGVAARIEASIGNKFIGNHYRLKTILTEKNGINSKIHAQSIKDNIGIKGSISYKDILKRYFITGGLAFIYPPRNESPIHCALTAKYSKSLEKPDEHDWVLKSKVAILRPDFELKTFCIREWHPSLSITNWFTSYGIGFWQRLDNDTSLTLRYQAQTPEEYSTCTFGQERKMNESTTFKYGIRVVTDAKKPDSALSPTDPNRTELRLLLGTENKLSDKSTILIGSDFNLLRIMGTNAGAAHNIGLTYKLQF